MCDIIIIAGPTGTGKTELAVEVAERLDGEIVSADSRQVYRRLEIGTAKPPAELRRRVPHFGLDLISLDKSYSAGRFALDAREWIAAIRGRGRVPILAGGTGFFIKAVLEPLAPQPESGARELSRLRQVLARFSLPELKAWLERLDPKRAAQLAAEGGPQKVARSLEVTLSSGRPHSWWLEQPAAARRLSASVFCLALPREAIYRRTDARFEKMMETGLLNEVRELMADFPSGAPGLKTLGYAELITHLEGALSLEEAVSEAKRNTRRYARRQLTWFRHQLPEDAVWLDAQLSVSALAERITACWTEMDEPASGSKPNSPIASGG